MSTFAGDYTKSDENGSPLVFAAITETATFPRVASLDAGCPGLTDGAVPPPGLPDQPAVPMIQDDRCANDLQARGPYRNNGTLPLESTLENFGASLKLAVRSQRATAAEIDQRLSRHSLDGRARRGQHAAHDPAHALRRAGGSVQPGAAAYLPDRVADRRVRPVLLRADLRRHRHGRAQSAAAGHSARQRQQRGRQQQLGRVHAVDVQRDATSSRSRRADATRKTRRARSPISSISPPRQSSRCRRSGIATRSLRSRRRRRSLIAGRTMR